jgi:hypothetical protein
MKNELMLLLFIFGGKAINAQNNFEVKSIPNAELLEQYPTCDESGKALELLSAVQVNLHQKECDPKGIPLHLKSADKREYTRPALYCWNPVLQHWKKAETLQKSKVGELAVFSSTIRCPGLYAFFDVGSAFEKGVLVSMPSKCAIRSVRIIQQTPAYSVFWEGKGTNELKLPFGPLQFDALLEISWEEAGNLKHAKYLCGALSRIDELPEAGTPRKLEIKPGKTIEFQSALFTNNQH